MANIDNGFRIEILSIDDQVLVTQGTADPTVGAGFEAPTGSLYLRTDGTLYTKVDTADVDWKEVKMVGGNIFVNLSESNTLSTGILDGGEISINGGDPTLFDVAAGVGLIVDNYTDTLNPTTQLIAWAAQTAITPIFLNLASRTFIAIDAAGAVLQSATPWTNVDHKNTIVLGNLGHANLTNIVAYRNNPDPAYDATIRLADLARAIGPFNVDGNVFSPNGALLDLAKSSGHTYRLGNNFYLDKRDTDTTTDPAEGPVSFLYSYRDGAGEHTLVTPAVTLINGTEYDDGSGTLATVPNGRWTVQVVKYFSGILGGPSTRIEYGQQLFATKQAALDLLPDPNHIGNPAFVDGVIRAYIILAAGATDLSDPADAEIVEAAKFGGSGGGQFSGSITDLQQAYNNSLSPEILTDGTRGSLNITEGTAVGGSLITLSDDAATVVFDVDVAGNVIIEGTLDGRDVALDGTNQDNHIADLTNPHDTSVDNLTDTILTAPANGETLVYNGSEWVNASPTITGARIVGVSATDTTPDYLGASLVAGTNVTLTVLNPGADEQIQISASGAGGGASVLNDLTDVTITGPVTGDALIYNGATLDWENTLLFVDGTKRTVQSVFGTINSASGTTQNPLTSVDPVVTDGSEAFNVAFTPKAADSEIRITISFAFAVSNAASQIAATVFRNAVAVGAMSDSAANSNDYQTVSFTLKDVGPFVPDVQVIYSMRFGKTGGNATWYLNTNNAGEDFGSNLSNNAYHIEEVIIT